MAQRTHPFAKHCGQTAWGGQLTRIHSAKNFELAANVHKHRDGTSQIQISGVP